MPAEIIFKSTKSLTGLFLIKEANQEGVRESEDGDADHRFAQPIEFDSVEGEWERKDKP